MSPTLLVAWRYKGIASVLRRAMQELQERVEAAFS